MGRFTGPTAEGQGNTLRVPVFAQRCPDFQGATMRFIFRTLLLCLVAGLVLSWFEIRPATLLSDSWRTLTDIARLGGELVTWAIPYILTGAIIVVPVVAIRMLFKRLSRRSNGND